MLHKTIAYIAGCFFPRKWFISVKLFYTLLTCCLFLSSILQLCWQHSVLHVATILKDPHCKVRRGGALWGSAWLVAYATSKPMISSGSFLLNFFCLVGNLLWWPHHPILPISQPFSFPFSADEVLSHLHPPHSLSLYLKSSCGERR